MAAALGVRAPTFPNAAVKICRLPIRLLMCLTCLPVLYFPGF